MNIAQMIKLTVYLDATERFVLNKQYKVGKQFEVSLIKITTYDHHYVHGTSKIDVIAEGRALVQSGKPGKVRASDAYFGLRSELPLKLRQAVEKALLQAGLGSAGVEL